VSILDILLSKRRSNLSIDAFELDGDADYDLGAPLVELDETRRLDRSSGEIERTGERDKTSNGMTASNSAPSASSMWKPPRLNERRQRKRKVRISPGRRPISGSPIAGACAADQLNPSLTQYSRPSIQRTASRPGPAVRTNVALIASPRMANVAFSCLARLRALRNVPLP